MSPQNSLLSFLAMVTVLGLSQPRASADCAPFYCSLNDPNSITGCGGVANGDYSFRPGVNDGAIAFGCDCQVGNGDVTFPDEPNQLFNVDAGSVSVWFMKTSSTSGGVLQIGTLGQADSVGLCYNTTSGASEADVQFELRTTGNMLGLLRAPEVLTEGKWTHIVAMWKDNGVGCEMWLFVDGLFVTGAYGYLPDTLNLTAGQLQIGVTGYYGHATGRVDELRFFDWDLLDSEVYAEYVYSSNRYRNEPTGKPVSTGSVRVLGKSLFVNGRPFRVRGVGYQPTPIGSWPTREVLDFVYSDPCILGRDIPLLRSLNANTIRLWSEPPDKTLLDWCYNGGVDPIYVIMGFWVDPTVDYGNPSAAAEIIERFCAYVEEFKDHPAVLAWGIGNENNLSYGGDKADWFALANDLALLAYILEGPSYHPTMVVNGGMSYFGDADQRSDDASMNYVDLWGHNAYPGEDFRCYFDYYDRLTAKPLIITEYGVDAYDNAVGHEDEAVQAQYAVQQWRQIREACVGGTIMAYSDEWWKAGDPNSHDPGGYYSRAQPDGFSNEEWWGMVRVEADSGGCDDVVARQVYGAMGAEYAKIGLFSSEPPADGTLPKTKNNCMLLTFDSRVTLPQDGLALSIINLHDSTDVSASFTYSIEPDGVTLKAKENGAVLVNHNWYGVTPGADLGAYPFVLDVCTLQGDADGNGCVLAQDYFPVKNCLFELTDCGRCDLDGDGQVLAQDYFIVKNHLFECKPPKP